MLYSLYNEKSFNTLLKTKLPELVNIMFLKRKWNEYIRNVGARGVHVRTAHHSFSDDTSKGQHFTGL